MKIIQEYRDNELFDFSDLKDNYSSSYIKKERKNDSFIKLIEKEVMSLSIKKKRKLFKTIIKTTIGFMALIPMKTHAQTIYTIPTMVSNPTQKLKFPIVDQLYELDFIPNELVTMIIQILYASPIIGAVMAILFIMGAGVLIAVGQRQKAEELTKNTMMGLCQILIAPSLILLLTFLTLVALGSVGGASLFN